MKKTKKIVLILMIAFLLVNVFNYNKVYAVAKGIADQLGPDMSEYRRILCSTCRGSNYKSRLL